MSNIFHDNSYINIETEIKKILNNISFSSGIHTKQSTRSSGDAYESIIKNNFSNIDKNKIINFKNAATRKSMEDFSFNDHYGNNYFVDVKTHRINTDFNMPNLTSIKRLAEFYKDEKNFFSILFISYEEKDSKHTVKRVLFFPIESLKWDCLRIGALGWGQIQIADAKNIEIDRSSIRDEWLNCFYNRVSKFYNTEKDKIKVRTKYFENLSTKE